MATDSDAALSGKATPSYLLPFTLVEEWSNSVKARPNDDAQEIFAFSARRLRVQAEFVQTLADGAKPGEIFRHQLTYVETMWRDYTQASVKILDRAGVSFTRNS